MEEQPSSYVDDLPDEVNISTFLWHIFKKGKFTDIEFAVREDNVSSNFKTFSAHKLILSIWSPYFADLFYSCGEQPCGVITLNNMNSKAFEEVLRFMYGHIPIVKSPALAYDILKIAVKFQIAKLVDVCYRCVDNIAPDVYNVFDFLEVAKNVENTKFKDRCISFIKKNTKGVFLCHNDHSVSADIINSILDMDELSLKSEYELLSWLFMWAKQKYVNDSIYSSPREVIKKFFPKLNFLTLTNREFASLFTEHQNILKEKEAFSILMSIALRKPWQMPEWFDDEAKLRKYKV